MQKILKNRNWTFPAGLYFTSKLELVSNILWMVVECTKELHELHNDYPLAPGKIEIKREILSNYQFKSTD